MDEIKYRLDELSDETKSIQETLESERFSNFSSVRGADGSRTSSRRGALEQQQQEETFSQLQEILKLSNKILATNMEVNHHENLIKDNEKLQASLNEALNANELLQQSIASYQQKISQLESDLNKKTVECTMMSHKVDSLTAELKDKSRQLSEVAKENQKLKAELAMQKKYCKCQQEGAPERSRSLSFQIKNLREELREKTVENEKLKEICKRAKFDAQRVYKHTDGEKSRLQEEYNRQLEEMSDLKTRNSLLELELEQKERELIYVQEAKKMATLGQREVERNFEALEDKYKNILVTEERLRTDLSDLAQEMIDLKSENTRRESQIMEELNHARKTIREQVKRMAQQEHNFKCLNENNKQMKAKLDQLIKQNVILKENLSDATKKLTEEGSMKDNLLDVIRVHEEEMTAMKEKIIKMSNTDQDLDRAMQSLSSLQKHNHELASKYQKLQADYDAIRENYDALVDMRHHAVRSLDSSKRMQEEQMQREAMLKAKMEELVAHIKTLLKDRDILTSILEEKHRDIVILNSKLTQYKGESASYQDEYPTSLHRPYYPSSLQELPNFHSESEPISLDPKIAEIQRMASKLAEVKEYWENGLKSLANRE